MKSNNIFLFTVSTKFFTVSTKFFSVFSKFFSLTIFRVSLFRKIRLKVIQIVSRVTTRISNL